MNLVIASPIRQQPDVLRAFLQSIDATGCDFWAYDDNDILESQQILQEFCAHPHRQILPGLSLPPSFAAPYRRLDTTHWWQATTLNRVGTIKDHMLDRFADSYYDDLLLVDSDIVIHPDLPGFLRGRDLPIVSEIFWTQWEPHTPLLPQVWQVHPGGFHNAQEIFQLRTPGTYRVAGLGACTLIQNPCNLSFAPIEGLEFQGEDRYFCLRANVAGIPLHVDTYLPAFHIYRDEDLGREAVIFPEGWEADIERWLQVSHQAGLAAYAGGTEPWVIDLLTALCRSIGVKRALEIGVYKGRTTAALAHAVDEVVAIDTQIKAAAVNNLMPHRNVQVIEGDAATVIPTLDGRFDFVYVDNGHTYEAVKAQIAAVWDKVAPAGILAFHDYYDAGVCAFVNERFPNAIVLETRPFVEQATGLALVQKRRE